MNLDGDRWGGGIVFFVLLFCGSDMHQVIVEDSCDVIEVNEVYGSDWAARRFTQVIFYDYRNKFDHVELEREWDHYIGDWRILNVGTVRKNHERKEWVLIFFDEKDDVVRVVKATSYRHTQANYDHEVTDRKRLPVGDRTPILSPIP